MARLRTLTFLLAVVLAASACGSGDAETQSSDPVAAPPAVTLAGHGAEIESARTVGLFQPAGLASEWPVSVPEPPITSVSSNTYRDRWTIGLTVLGPIDADPRQAVTDYGLQLDSAGFEQAYVWDMGETLAATYERSGEFVQVESFVDELGLAELAVTYTP